MTQNVGNDAPVVVQWAHVLDDAGSADVYDTEAEAREALALTGGGLERIEVTTVAPFHAECVTCSGRGVWMDEVCHDCAVDREEAVR